MKEKLKKCKSCGADIAKSASVCPSCGAKQHQAVKAICIVLVAIFICGAIVAAFGGGEDKPALVSKAPSASTSPSNNVDSSPVFGVGETASLRDINVTLVSVKESTGGNYMSPSDGNVFVLCEFEIENNSGDDIAVSSILSFKAYVDDYTTNMSLSATISSDKTQLDGTISSGKKMNGVIGYEVPNDWSTIEVSFTPDFWAGTDIVYNYSK